MHRDWVGFRFQSFGFRAPQERKAERLMIVGFRADVEKLFIMP